MLPLEVLLLDLLGLIEFGDLVEVFDDKLWNIPTVHSFAVHFLLGEEVAVGPEVALDEDAVRVGEDVVVRNVLVHANRVVLRRNNHKRSLDIRDIGAARDLPVEIIC